MIPVQNGPPVALSKMEPPSDVYIEDKLSNLINTVGIQQHTTSFGGYQQINTRWDLEKSVRTMQPLLIGFMRREQDYWNTVVCPLVVDNSEHLERTVHRMGTQLPQPTAQFGPAVVIKMMSNKISSPAIEYDAQFEVAGRFARTAEGAELIGMFLEHMSQTFLHDAKVVSQSKVVATAEQALAIPNTDPNSVAHVQFHAERRDQAGMLTKSAPGFFASLIEKKNQIADLSNGIEPGDMLFPRELRPLMMQIPDLTKHYLGGDEADRLFWDDQDRIGEIHGVKFLATARLPNKKQKSSMLMKTRVEGDFAFFKRRPDQGKAIFAPYDLNADQFVPFSLDKFVGGFFGYDMFDPNNAEHKRTLRLALYSAFYESGMITNPNDYKVKFDLNPAKKTGFIYMPGDATEPELGAAPKHYDAVKAHIEAVIKSADNDKATEATLAMKAQGSLVSSFGSIMINRENMIGAVVYAQKASVKADEAVCALHVFSRYPALFKAVYDAMGPDVSSFFPKAKSVGVLIQAVFDRTEQPVAVVNLKELHNRLKVCDTYMQDGDTAFTKVFRGISEADGKTQLMAHVPRCEALVLSADHIDDNYVTALRPFKRFVYYSSVLMIAGEATCISSVSEPYISAAEDTNSFVNKFHAAQLINSLITNPEYIAMLPDIAYHSYISGETSGILTYANLMELRVKYRWVIPKQDDPSMILIPCFGEPAPVNALNLHNPNFIPHGKFWLEYTWLGSAMPEMYKGGSHVNRVAKVLFPMNYQYANTSGNMVTVYGNPHCGAWGQLPGAAKARKTNKFPIQAPIV